MYQIILHSEYLGHIWHRRFFKFIPRTYLQTAGWVMQRLELWTLQPCLANLATEISLTFELQWQTWPSFLIFDPFNLLLPFAIPFFRIFSSSPLPYHIRKVYLIQLGAKESPDLPFCTCGGKWISQWWFGPLHGLRCPVCPPAAEAPMKKIPVAFKGRTFLYFATKITEINMHNKKILKCVM